MSFKILKPGSSDSDFLEVLTFGQPTASLYKKAQKVLPSKVEIGVGKTGIIKEATHLGKEIIIINPATHETLLETSNIENIDLKNIYDILLETQHSIFGLHIE